MKTKEDLNRETKDVLLGIATDLGGNPSKRWGKPELVDYVFDLQQADPEPENTGDEPEVDEGNDGETHPIEPDTQLKASEVIAKRIAEIEEHFDGDASEEGEDENGTPVFVVRDFTGDEIVGGTLERLMQIKNNQLGGKKKAEAVGGDEDEDISIQSDDPAIVELENELRAMRALGLRYAIDGTSIRFTCGQRHATTTLKQPLNRVLRVAERQCQLPR